MARSQKSEEKVAKKEKKEEEKKKKKQNKEKKDYEFRMEVALITHGKVPKGASFSRDDVKKYASSSKTSSKGKKKSQAKVFSNKIEFKDKIISGNRNRKQLSFVDIKVLEQLSTDGRAVFVGYGRPNNDYFVVLELADTTHVTKFMTVVKEDNSDTKIRWAEGPSLHSSREIDSDDLSLIMGRVSVPRTYCESEGSQRSRSANSSTRSLSHDSNPWATKNSFICADPYFDDGTVYSSKASDTFTSQISKHSRPSRQHSSYSSLSLSNSGPRLDTKQLITQYYHVGSSDEERRGNSRYKKSSHHKHQHYALGDEVSVSMTSNSIFSDGDNYSNDDYKVRKNGYGEKAHSRMSNVSRKSSHRPKSRELPLSEAERSRGGWHSDVIFVTPTKDGGVKVSPDGPVMLYTATRANVNSDSSSASEEDTYSGEETEVSYSSGSTLTLEGPVRKEIPSGFEITYTS